MILSSIELEFFRNYSKASFSFSPQVNILCGDNGKGKTNLLEAIFLLTGVRSWRTIRKTELIHWEKSKSLLKAKVSAREREFNLMMELPSAGKTQVWVNGIKKHRQLELSHQLRCVLFSPEDLTLVKGSAAGRRAFLDHGISQLRPRYGELLSRYEKLLESKNRLLREQTTPAESLLEIYNQQLAQIGSLLIGYRASFCRGLTQECGRLHRAISRGKEELTIEYHTVKTVTDPFASAKQIENQLLEHLESHQSAELQSRSCLSGIHRDDLVLYINGKLAKAFASQGQSRSAALALKFGQRELFFRDGGEYPVLLLDDVLSELDGPRQEFVASHAMGGQSIITTCNQEKRFSNANMIYL